MMDGSTIVGKSLFELSCFSREEENKMKEMGNGERNGEEMRKEMEGNLVFQSVSVHIAKLSSFGRNEKGNGRKIGFSKCVGPLQQQWQ